MKNLLEEITLLSSTASVLGWDQETYAPVGAVGYRAKQMGYLQGKIHELQTSGEFLELVKGMEGGNERELRYRYERATKLPRELVERDAETSSLAKVAWSEARGENDFGKFAGFLEKLLLIAREKAECWGYEDEPYDALLGGYERGAKTREVGEIFEGMKGDLVEIAAGAVERSAGVPADGLRGEAPVEKQVILNREVAEFLGFDFERGRIDTTTHPFCSRVGPTDVRMTTRYDEGDFTSSLFGVMHEAGHGLYEQGLPSGEFHLPSGRAVSLGIHESQSRLWENHVGRSRVFWERWFPRAQELFGYLRGMELEEFLAGVNRAAYSPIRVEADEATYDLHILLRFRIERAMLRGDLKVEEVPAAWNEWFAELFHFYPKNDMEGCLQDIHWSMGGLGYFATYSLGNLNAAQLMETAMEDEGVASGFRGGDFLPLLGWMREKVHRHGSLFLPQELMARATGRGTEPGPYLRHLRGRFLG